MISANVGFGIALTALIASIVAVILTSVLINGKASVAGPESSVINHLAKFGDDTGALLAKTGVELDNSNNMAGINNIEVFSATIKGNLNAASINVGEEYYFPRTNGAAGQILVANKTGELQWKTQNVFRFKNYAATLTWNTATSSWPIDNAFQPIQCLDAGESSNAIYYLPDIEDDAVGAVIDLINVGDVNIIPIDSENLLKDENLAIQVSFGMKFFALDSPRKWAVMS